MAKGGSFTVDEKGEKTQHHNTKPFTPNNTPKAPEKKPAAKKVIKEKEAQS